MRVLDDDVPRHRRKRGRRKKWRVQMKWRRPWLVGKGWVWGGSYENERAAMEGMKAHAKNYARHCSAVRMIDPEGNVVAIQMLEDANDG